MIFHRLEISDFLVFKGKNTLTFPVTDDEPSMVVVLAPNNSGKTTIIKALRFLLYGTRPPGELCNHAAVDELRPGDRLNAWVGATVSVGNRSYTFRRRIDARKTKDGASEIENVILEQTQHDRGGDVYSPDQGEITRLLNSLVPEALFDFFYFQGETLADKLLQRSAHSSIGEALATLLHHKQWIRAAEAVDAVHAKLAEDIQDLSEVDRAYADQLKLVTQLEEKVAQSTRESAEFEQTTRDAAAEYESLGRQILDISTGKSFEDVAKKLDQIRKEFIDAGNQTGRVETEIAQTIGDSRGLPFFHDAFGAARAVLDSMQRENLLPADVVEGFLQRLLDHQRCLCGRSLNEHEAEARAAVEAYRTRALSQDVNAALLDLLDRLSPNVQRNFTKFAISAAQGLEDQLLRRKKLLLRSKELESQASTLEDEIKRSNHEEVLRLQTRQKEALRRKDDFGEKRRKTEIYLGQQKNMLREAKDVLTRLGGKGFGARFDKLTKARIQAGALAELIRETIACLKDSFQSILQQNLTLLYDANVTDGSKARVDPESLLPAIEQRGRVIHNVGGGQRQLLVLAHIVSLARLRQQLHAELTALGINMGKLDDQSFFLDSVFAPADKNYGERIAHFLPRKARQIVVLVASQQWEPWVSEPLSPHITRAFKCVLASENPPEGHTMKLNGKTIETYRPLKRGDASYSVLEEVPLQ